MNNKTTFYYDNKPFDFASIIKSKEVELFLHKTKVQETFSKLTEENIESKKEQIWNQINWLNDCGYISEDLQTAIFETETFLIGEADCAFHDCVDHLNKKTKETK